ncbi:MAG: type II toxin-antitoxin system HicB family antitoxin [Cyanobacteria bacterium SBLK]|nr:type II toxin-antitoxin system HicB family antitoxin [Cyanobacteria bacterium SBLK]
MTLSTSTQTRTVILSIDEDGYIVAEVPSLPGCISQGETREIAINNIQEAISLHLEVLQERGETIPDDRIEVVYL